MSNPDFNSPELPATGLVEDLDPDDRRLLSDYGEFLPLQAGTDLIKEGEPQNCLYLVLSGVLHVHRLKDNKRTLLGRIEPGESIGEVAIFDPGPASANITAQEFCQIWKATREDLDNFLKAYPEAGTRFLLAILGELSRRLRLTNEKLSTAELETAFKNLFG